MALAIDAMAWPPNRSVTVVKPSLEIVEADDMESSPGGGIAVEEEAAAFSSAGAAVSVQGNSGGPVVVEDRVVTRGGGGATTVLPGGPRAMAFSWASGLQQTNAWLGVITEEAPEAVAAQLALDAGTGLLVSHVTPESPAAKAGLEKHDVLVRFDDQRLVHPAQLRKLVQVRKEGDEVKLVYYRTGKENTATIKLGKTQGFAGGDGFGGLKGDLTELRRQFESGPIRENIEKQMLVLKDSMGHLKLDQEKVQEDIRRSMEEARRAMEQALRQSGAAKNEAGKAARQALAELRKAEAQNRAGSVVVRSGKHDVRTMVKSDDEGTLVLVSQPKPRLTAHDKEGNLIYDGPVATQQEQERVPKALLERVQPMLKEFMASETKTRNRTLDIVEPHEPSEAPRAEDDHNE